MASKRDPAWRDRAAGALLAKHVRRLPGSGRALVMEDPSDEASTALAGRGLEVERWWRRAIGGRAATAWPPPGPFDLVALRLPKAKDELEMSAHAAASVLTPDGTLVVYGAKDEGIGSAGRRVEPVLGPVRTLATGGHCRLLAATRPAEIAGLKSALADWRVETSLGVPGLPDPWISYPGVFAHGRLDTGTRMLLDVLPEPRVDERILDFGCGSGVLAAACAANAAPPAGTDEAESVGGDTAGNSTARPTIDGLDVDAVALRAFEENVPVGRALLADGLGATPNDAYTLIVSNPPYHQGKAESMAVVEAFLGHAPRVLARGGRLVMVAQRRLPVDERLRSTFAEVRSLAGDGTFQVWVARRE